MWRESYDLSLQPTTKVRCINNNDEKLKINFKYKIR